HPRLRADDGKDPVIAGGVPIELVVVLKAAGHAVHAIGQHVAMLAPANELVAVADPDTDEIAHAFGAERLGRAIARHRLDAEFGADLVARMGQLHRGDIAVDTTPDVDALGIDLDG